MSVGATSKAGADWSRLHQSPVDEPEKADATQGPAPAPPPPEVGAGVGATPDSTAITAPEVTPRRIDAGQVQARVEDRRARERADSQMGRLRAELDRSVDAPTSLLTERLGDEDANCLENAATHARPGRDEVVFLNDTRTAQGGDINGAGHTLIRDRASGRVWDPNDGVPPANPRAWPHRDTAAWIANNGGAPAGRPAYEEIAAIPAERVQEVLAQPPEARAAHIAGLQDPALSRVAGRMFADGPQGAPAGDPSIPEARRVAIDGYVAEYADTSFPGQETMEALRGDSDLGALNEAEQRYLLNQTVADWRGREDAGLYLGYGTGRITAETEGDPALGRVVSDVFARQALDAAQQGDRDGQHESVTLASRAVRAAGSPEARRALLDELGPEAGAFAAALRPGDDQLFGFHTAPPGERQEAVGQMLGAAALGEPNEATGAFTEQAFLDLPPEAYEGRQGEETRRNMAGALASHWHEDDPSLRASEAARFEGILGTSQGRDLLANTDVPPQARADAVNLLRTHPEFDAASLSAHDGNGWTHPTLMREMARPRARDFLELRGDSPQALPGTDLENTVGFAMGFPPSVPEGETAAARDAREAAVAAGTHSYYQDGPAGEAVRPVADAIRAVGGDTPQVTVLPVQYASEGTGPVELPLFRVQDPATGDDRFVDNTGRTYSSFDDWRENNQLPPGNMVYPSNGHLGRTAAGEPALGTGNTPRTVDTFGEHAGQFLDGAALVGGVVAGGFIIAGSGGTAAPFVLGGASAWGAYRSGDRLHDRATHGQSINPFTDAGARAEWLNFGANTLGVVGLGATGIATRLAARGSALTPLAASAAGALNVAAAGADALAVGDAGYTLATRWDELSGGERAQLGMSMAFWGASVAARPRVAGAGSVDAFDAPAMRRALIDQETSTQLGRADAYVQQTLPPGAQGDASTLLAGVAANDRIQGFRDWVGFSTQRPGVDPQAQARNLADDLGELQVAQALTPGLRPGESVHVGGDAHAPNRPGTTDPLTSFDLTVQGPHGQRNIEVYSPSGPPQHGQLGAAINHARDKIVRDPTLPAGLHTQGSIEAAVRLGWPPPVNQTGGGRVVTAPNGDVRIHTRDGRTIDRGNFFDDYVNTLNGRGAPAGARDVDALTVYDQSGAALYRYTRDPATGTWTGAPE